MFYEISFYQKCEYLFNIYSTELKFILEYFAATEWHRFFFYLLNLDLQAAVRSGQLQNLLSSAWEDVPMWANLT